MSDLDCHDGYDFTIMSFEWPLDTTVLHEDLESVAKNRVPGLLQAAGEHQATYWEICKRIFFMEKASHPSTLLGAGGRGIVEFIEIASSPMKATGFKRAAAIGDDLVFASGSSKVR